MLVTDSICAHTKPSHHTVELRRTQHCPAKVKHHAQLVQAPATQCSIDSLLLKALCMKSKENECA